MEGAMAVIDDNLIRMKELAEQAATGSYSTDQRDIMQAEFAEMASEIDRIAGSTSFNGITMLDDTTGTGTVTVHVGSTTTITVDKCDMTESGLSLDSGGGAYEQEVSTAGFASADDVMITGNDKTFQITFDGGNAGEVDIVTAAFANGVDYTLNEVVTAINVASQATAAAYNAASAAYTSSSGQWNLKIVHNATGDVTSVFDDVNNQAGLLAANFTNTAGAAGGALDIGGDGSGATAALTAVENAINTKDEARAAFGYKMNRLEGTIAVLDIQAENLLSAESRISDVDVATEMANMTRTQVLSQAGVAMLAQANAMPQMALTLLR